MALSSKVEHAPLIMLTKRCSSCKETKDSVDFALNTKKPDGLQSVCRACKKVSDKAYYKIHKVTQRRQINAAVKIRRDASKEVIRNYLQTHPCVDCGETDIIVLDFDHVRGEKDAEISRLVANGASILRIEAEIEKCEIRCANCHRRATHRRRFGLIAQSTEHSVLTRTVEGLTPSQSTIR